MKKSQKFAGLAEENGFGSAYTHNLRWLVKWHRMISTCKKMCNKYDLTTT
jgi:hypothetical protein